MKLALSIGLALVLQLVLVVPAFAATCTVSGRIRVQSMDSYYCDRNFLADCAQWNEQDLDTTDKPLQHMLVSLHSNVAARTVLATTATDTTGFYSLTFTATACPANAILVEWMARVHEADHAAAVPRLRFAVALTSEPTVWSQETLVTLTANSGTKNITHNRSTTGAPDQFAQYTNVYYTVNSALTTMISWHADIDSYFQAPWVTSSGLQGPYFLVRYNPNVALAFSGAFNGTELLISGESYNRGSVARHELGHAVHAVIHGTFLPTPTSPKAFRRRGSCGSYEFGKTAPPGQLDGHGADSCEWASTATDEAIASFFGVRSITTSDGAFECNFADPLDPDFCSERVATFMAPDADRIIFGVNGIGDTFASTVFHCAQVRTMQGCQTCNTTTAGATTCTACMDINADGNCDGPAVWGFRNEVNIARYLWDLIDTHNEGTDNADTSVVGVLTALKAMSCNENVFGVDGTCNEPNRFSPSSCSPTSIWGTTNNGALGTATRDSYNTTDLNQLLNSGDSSETMLNCVAYALD